MPLDIEFVPCGPSIVLKSDTEDGQDWLFPADGPSRIPADAEYADGGFLVNRLVAQTIRRDAFADGLCV